MVQREVLQADVLIVGAGPAGLACALRLAQRAAAQPGALELENVYVLEKGREVGAHLLSGAILDLRSLRELLPGSEAEAPLDCPVASDAVYFFTQRSQFRFPITPPFLHNAGNYVVSLNRLGKWMGQKVEQAGITIFTETAGVEVLYDQKGAVAGVRTGDKGVDRQGRSKENHQPGSDLRARVTVLAEGPRGSLAEQLFSEKGLKKLWEKGLEKGSNPMTYSLGLKELWELPPGSLEPGTVIHTMGWPLTREQYGGGFLYGMRNNLVSLGLVVGLDYRNPLLDPHTAFQHWKTHPFLRALLEGGRLVKYGAKTIPEGGYFSMPRLVTDGAVILGDSAGLLNAQRLKGIHLAIKSGMLAADAIVDAFAARDFSQQRLSAYERNFQESWAGRELWKVRNFHQAYEKGLLRGMLHTGLQMLTGGRGLRARYPAEAGHRRLKKLPQLRAESPHWKQPPAPAPDGRLTFDKLTDVFHSATKHEEDQPAHLLIHDTNICNDRCTREFGNPCQYFCPAAVYEMVEKDGRQQIHLNPSNCVHCKTCDIMDPYEIITWVPPEGGGGPNYENL